LKGLLEAAAQRHMGRPEHRLTEASRLDLGTDATTLQPSAGPDVAAASAAALLQEDQTASYSSQATHVTSSPHDRSTTTDKHVTSTLQNNIQLSAFNTLHNQLIATLFLLNKGKDDYSVLLMARDIIFQWQILDQTVNDGVAHSKNPRKSAYHVTFDPDLEHTLDAGLPGDHRVQVWWRSGHLSARRSDLRKCLQTDDGRLAIALDHSWNELKIP